MDVKFLHYFLSMLLSGDSQEDINEAASSSFSFLLWWIQLKLSMLIIFLFSFQMFSHAGATLNHSSRAIQLFRSAEDASGDSCFHS